MVGWGGESKTLEVEPVEYKIIKPDSGAHVKFLLHQLMYVYVIVFSLMQSSL